MAVLQRTTKNSCKKYPPQINRKECAMANYSLDRDSRPPSLRQHPVGFKAGKQPPHPAERRQPQEPDSSARYLLRQQFHRSRGRRRLPGEDTITTPISSFYILFANFKPSLRPSRFMYFSALATVQTHLSPLLCRLHKAQRMWDAFDISHNLLDLFASQTVPVLETLTDIAALLQPAAARGPPLFWNDPRGLHTAGVQQNGEVDRAASEGNRIATLGSEIHALTQLKILSINNNQIRTISTNQIPPKLTQLFLAGNPFLCDKQLLPFLKFLNSTENLTTDEDLCTPSENGTAPASPLARCPAPCRCFSTNDNLIFADCSSSGLTNLPPFFTEEQVIVTTFHLKNRDFATQLHCSGDLPCRANKEVPFVIAAEIEGLNLSNNKIQSLEEARLPNRTKFLFLDHNLIRKLPVSLLESLEFRTRVTLSNNPWTCDCAALDFKKWVVSKSILVLDMNEARCGPDMPNNPGLAERAILMLPDRELCPDNTGLYISKGFGVVTKELLDCGFIVPVPSLDSRFFLVVAGGIIAWTRYKMNVKVWLYSHGVTWVKEKDIDRDKEFDAFISFSFKDQDLVIQELIEVIEEKDPDIRLCLHYKHFLPGEFIERNIMRAVECSKRTVLVLSRNFLESEWCLLEFNAAHAQALKDQVPHIIVIKLPDLPKDDELPKEIQLYLNSTTYLTWGEKHFWSKLLYILPEVAVRLETRIQRRCQTSNPHERFLRLKASFHISECVHSHTPH
ncbi:protein toll [Caerostris extrusa]|uniref:Protein toll n=1 Tax=Caerostris extrusa TaxID=172846 RepID=A0AAV4RFR1_CAEEX|nr:protein toll [Caerostris extrusa]